MGKAYIYAGEDIRSKFIENAEVVCCGDAETGAMLYCNLLAGGRVVLKDRKGMVIGGEITAGREIICKGVGSEMGSMTILQVGKNGTLNSDVKHLTEEITMLEKKRVNVLKVIKFYKGKLAAGEKLSKEESYKLKEMVSEQGRMTKKIDRMNEKMALINIILDQEEDPKKDRIIVSNELGMNVKLAVNGANHITRKEYESIRAIKYKGDIRIAYYSLEFEEEEED